MKSSPRAWIASERRGGWSAVSLVIGVTAVGAGVLLIAQAAELG
ncbi:MAG: hypothetical protein ABIX11_05600 [Casimicrobiaceae bacterium]